MKGLNKTKITFKSGRCEELTVNGIDMSNCIEARVTMTARNIPMLTLKFLTTDLEMELDGCDVERL